MTRTGAELSVVCREDLVPAGARSRPGWRALTVAGPLDLSMVGVLASLATVLAAAGVAVFVLSTFDTDHVLVRDDDLTRAVGALRGDGHTVHGAAEQADRQPGSGWPGSTPSTARANSRSSRVMPPASWVTSARVTRL